MSSNLKYLILALSFVFIFSNIAFAQETTGNIQGTVRDPAGARIAGATIELVSESFRRTVTTDSEGNFLALQLPVGTYTVNVTAPNFQPYSRRNIVVILGQTAPVDVTLAVLGATAEVVVLDTDELAIDPRSSRVQTNLTERELELLPKGVGFSSALKAVPSVRAEPSAAGFSVDGATGVENSFIIDGQEVSNFRTGALNLNNDIPVVFVKELQVKNSGFEAEFGGATGGVISVVTKSGGNDFHGDFGMSFITPQFNARPRPILRNNENALEYIIPTKDEGVDFFPVASLSGPIIPDRLWFFASASPQYVRDTRLWTFPDGSIGEFRSRQEREYYFARLDAAVTDELRVFSTFTYNPITVNGVNPTFNTLRAAGRLGASSAVDPASTRELGGRIAANNFVINGTYVPTSNLIFNASWSRGYLNERYDFATGAGSFGVPTVTRFQCVTSGFQCVAGFNNVPTNDNLVKDISIRKNFEVNSTFIIPDFGGRHQFKVGYQRFDISNEVETGYITPGRVLFYFGRTTVTETGEVFGNRPGEVGYARLVLIGEFGEASSSNQAFYIQDAWQPISRLSIQAGLRVESEDVPSFQPNFPGIKFGWGDKIAPRLGFAYDVLGNGRWKVFANYGQFFDRFKYELPRGSFGGNIFDDYRAPLLASMPDIFAYTKEYVLANSLVYTNFRVPSNDPSDFRVDPDLRPVRQTEYTAGTAFNLGANTVFQARYTHKQIDETIEDIGYHDEFGNEAYFIGNPGRGICELPACGRYNIPGAEVVEPVRDYDALELVVDKRFGRNAWINASYTFSRLYGNYSGLASTDEFSINQTARDSPNVNRFFDTPFGAFVVGGEQALGRLPTDRPHSFKLFGAYTFNNADSFFRLPPSNELELSVFTEARSGTPITTRVDLIDDAYISLFGRGDLGRTETYTNTDFGIAYRYRFGRDNRFGIQFNVDILNAFNESNVLARFESITPHVFEGADFAPFGVDIGDNQDFDRAFFDGRITADRIMQLINTCVDTAPNTPGNQCDPVEFDARYQEAQFFQGPRTVRFGFRFIF